MKTINNTNFSFPNQTKFYRGKVREVYTINDNLIVMIATDRISAFDVVLPKQIPFKGQVLNQIAEKMLAATQEIVPNWLLATPHPNVAIGQYCQPFKVEMVIRGYLVGHAAREYNLGKRTISGVTMPNGMLENEVFPKPIITPSTKAQDGLHDEDISKEEIIKQGIVSKEDYEVLEKYTFALYQKGVELAKEQGLILVDTKYEFGKTKDGKIILIDEIHTPDSSRYFYADTYKELLKEKKPQRQLSKEFVRQWLIENNFQGKEGQQVPEMTAIKINEISERYIELYEQITGETFCKDSKTIDLDSIQQAIEGSI
ncbi:MAG TPA: phosphoribosylaminoimidazolesuccinocarboxamide synthase [Lutibacter sp.]|nr:phosphoribosylaminoimidazolesuccinocarboxamide synthase [Lutibacter sp.]